MKDYNKYYDKITEGLANDVVKEIKNKTLEKGFGSKSVLEEKIKNLELKMQENIATIITTKLINEYDTYKNPELLEKAEEFTNIIDDSSSKYEIAKRYLLRGDIDKFKQRYENLKNKPNEDLSELVRDLGKKYFFKKEQPEKTFEYFSLLNDKEKYKDALYDLAKNIEKQKSRFKDSSSDHYYFKESYLIYKKIEKYDDALRVVDKLLLLNRYTDALNHYIDLKNTLKEKYEEISKTDINSVLNDTNEQLENKVNNMNNQENNKENSKEKEVKNLLEVIDTKIKKLYKNAFKNKNLEVAYKASKELNDNSLLYELAVYYLDIGEISKFKEIGQEISGIIRSKEDLLLKRYESQIEKQESIFEILNKSELFVKTPSEETKINKIKEYLN